MQEASANSELQEVQRKIESLTWYHSIDLGNGLVTRGFYDHRPYLNCYGLPKDLTGKTVLDIGTASGFFAFELEKRGAEVVATDLPTWMAHDFGPLYQPDMDPERAHQYLHDPFLFAHKMLRSDVKRQIINIYDITPQTLGSFDLVFCGSVLLHLTDPIKALWRIQSVTREVAIIATGIHPLSNSEPLSLFVGHHRGDVWWLPNRAALEAMVKSAGFKGWEWFSEFRLDPRNGQPGFYHGVIRAWNTLERPKLLDKADQPVKELIRHVAAEDPEAERLRDLVNIYEKMKCIQFVRWLHPYRQKLTAWLKQWVKTNK
jgi:tRNA (mo5U34)-methyltransferase